MIYSEDDLRRAVRDVLDVIVEDHEPNAGVSESSAVIAWVMREYLRDVDGLIAKARARGDAR